MHCCQGSASKFSMKLLLGQKVVLVEHPDLEPQLFVPVLEEAGVALVKLTFDPPSESKSVEKPSGKIFPRDPLGSTSNRSHINPSSLEDVIPNGKHPPNNRNNKTSRERQIRGRDLLHKKDIEHVPPPFDVIPQIYYLDRNDFIGWDPNETPRVPPGSHA